jgi:hypothetical protein
VSQAGFLWYILKTFHITYEYITTSDWLSWTNTKASLQHN